MHVLLLCHDDPGQSARLGVALDLVRAFSADLTCIDISPFPVAFDQSVPFGSALLRDETRREVATKDWVERRLEEEGLAWTWRDLRDDFIPCLIEAAAGADVVVVSRRLDNATRPNMLAAASALLVHTTALVIAVPEHCQGLHADLAVVAWDGSEHSLSALEGAKPLMRLARRTLVLQVGALPKSSRPLEVAITSLSSCDVSAASEILPAQGRIAEAICEALIRLDASYCVMGAFRTGRIRQALFGGVTRHMLKVAPIPLVLAHRR
jgi:nucleotide-binding universal stress UspA family protein